jgi:hypothetical protein
LPDNYVNVNGNSNNSFSQSRSLATRTPAQSIELLVYHFKEGSRLVYNKKDDGKNPAQPYGTYYRSTPITHSVDVLVENLPFNNAKYRKFVIDRDHSNSLAYKTMNNTDDYNRINAHDDLEEVETKMVSFSNNEFRESLTMQENSVTLIILENNNVEPGPHLGVSTNTVDFGVYANTKTFSVYNYGDQPLSWNATAHGNQLIQSVEPTNGTLQPNMSEIVSVTVDRTNLSDGDYNESIQFTSNGGNAVVSVTGNVGGPPLPSFYRLNAGGYSYTDASGHEWLADVGYAPGGCGFIGGKTSNTSDPIARTDKDILYQTERYDLKSYQFDLPTGSYQVVLHFAEIYFEVPNERIMSVAIEGNVRLSDMDLFNEVGHDAALIRTFSNINVTDGTLNLDFSASSRVPKISAIEVIEISQIEPGTDIEAPNPPAGVQVRKP